MRSDPSNTVNPSRAILEFVATERLRGLYRGIFGALVGVIPYSMSMLVLLISCVFIVFAFCTVVESIVTLPLVF